MSSRFQRMSEIREQQPETPQVAVVSPASAKEAQVISRSLQTDLSPEEIKIAVKDVAATIPKPSIIFSAQQEQKSAADDLKAQARAVNPKAKSQVAHNLAAEDRPRRQISEVQWPEEVQGLRSDELTQKTLEDQSSQIKARVCKAFATHSFNKHQVNVGDNWGDLSKKFYGTSRAWTYLYAINSENRPSADLLHVGSVIYYPVLQKSESVDSHPCL